MFISFPLLASALFALSLVGCGSNEASIPEPMPTVTPPLADDSEGRVEAEDGKVAAELIATPILIPPDGRVQVSVVNRGDKALNFGRPITVERWDGAAWVETEESRNAAWTMELFDLEPGTTGEEQTWPFHPDQRPEPGWHRISKHVSAEPPGPGQDSISLTIRTRVEVRE